MTVLRLPKQEAAKVDFSSHCAIPLLNTHRHPKIHIPNIMKPVQTMSDQDLWSKSEIKALQQSVKRAQGEWLINTSRSEKSREYGVEWGRYMSQMVRESSSESASLLPATQYHYGPLIDSPPSPLILSRQVLYT